MERGQTDRQTHRHTDIATTRLNRPRGRFSENSSSGDLVGWGKGGRAVHFTAEHLSTLLSIELHCTYFPCNALHYKVKIKIYI